MGRPLASGDRVSIYGDKEFVDINMSVFYYLNLFCSMFGTWLQ